jgi:peptidoglycan/LPS O-acetylase OafA/YrhL
VPRTTEHIRSLDLCRGLAALLVLLYHIQFLFWDDHSRFQRGYLCVDFFFLLSGFVIANSYERKIEAGLGFFEFVALRVARLWPLVALTTLIGLMVQLPRAQREWGGLDPFAIAVTAISNGASLPSPMSPTEFLFPLNGAAWSIFFELVANLAYILLVPFLTRGLLLVIIGLSGCMLMAVGIAYGNIDVGWSTANFVYGFPRVAFTFFLGVYLYRGMRPPAESRFFGPAPLMLGLVATLALVCLPRGASPAANGIVDCLIVIVAFPALLVLALRTRFRSWGNSVAWLAGGISYSVYLLQTPLMIGFAGLPQVIWGTKIAAYTPWAGFVFVALCLVAAYVSWMYFEQPVQRWLVRVLLGRRPLPGNAAVEAIKK